MAVGLQICLIMLLASLALAAVWMCRSTAACLRIFQDPSRRPPDPSTRALVILCLRGADPFLTQTLQGLSQQSHRNFLLRMVLDRADDPAATVVQEFLASDPGIEVETQMLQARRVDCGLKVSSLLEATEDVSSFDVLVLVDADAVPFREWLSDLLLPFTDPRVGGVSGLRCFYPQRQNLGSLVRAVWGAAATIEMATTKILWGGSLALRREAFEHAGVRAHWQSSLCDDVPTSRLLRSAGYAVQHCAVVMINRESVSLQGCLEFIARQLVLVRLAREGWGFVLLFAFLHGLGGMGMFALLSVAALQNQWGIFAAGASGLLAYTLVYRWQLRRLGRQVRRRAVHQGLELQPPGWGIYPAMFATACLYPWIVLRSHLMRVIRWRGAVYHVLPSGRIRLVEDRPPAAARVSDLDHSVL